MRRNHVPRSVWTNPRHFLAFGCGAGVMPFAPGTFGTLVAVPVYLLAQNLPLATYLAGIVVLFVIGIWLCGVTARDMALADPSGIVWDEIIGYLITMTAAPRGWFWVTLGFVLFRVFDIAKPWPIRALDRNIKGGLGIMLDDVAAGIAACALLHLAVWLVAYSR